MGRPPPAPGPSGGWRRSPLIPAKRRGQRQGPQQPQGHHPHFGQEGAQPGRRPHLGQAAWEQPSPAGGPAAGPQTAGAPASSGFFITKGRQRRLRGAFFGPSAALVHVNGHRAGGLADGKAPLPLPVEGIHRKGWTGPPGPAGQRRPPRRPGAGQGLQHGLGGSRSGGGVVASPSSPR